MHDPNTQLNEVINTSLALCRSWLVDNHKDGIRLHDPVDQKTVPAHYGDSHFAAALVILGQLRGEKTLVEQGIESVKSVMLGWNNALKFNDFHHDFNNFALCIIEERLRDTYTDISRNIRELVISTGDSRHNTINWLPMRAYVNRSRYEWTGEKEYEDNAHRCIRIITEATNDDGGIEDRLPEGSSYNLQYNVSSLAALLFLKGKWKGLEYDFDRGQSFLLDHVLPDGDINYVGRGTNQIFAWGPWLYALACARSNEELRRALEFLSRRYPLTVKNHNILLNEFPGAEKLFWWDYHYSSVYHAHFLLWSVLALSEMEREKTPVSTEPKKSRDTMSLGKASTGLSIRRGRSGGAVVFGGRSIYLAESGTALCALWNSENTVLFKGGLGPWQGAFGKKHTFADLVFLNHFGLISQKAPRSFLDNRLEKIMNWKYAESREAVIRAEFGEFDIEFDDASIRVVIVTDEIYGYFNAPLLADVSAGHRVEFMVDGRKLQSIMVARFKSQYGWTNAIRSKTARGKRWEVTISGEKILEKPWQSEGV